MRYVLSLSIMFSLFFSGCGFQLRGLDNQLSDKFKKTYIVWKGDVDSLFYRNVKRLITLNGGRITDKKPAQTIIYLSPIAVDSRQIALSFDGSTKEYEKNYKTTVTIVDKDSGVKLGSRTIKTVQNIQLNDSQVLAGQEQTDITNANAETLLSQSVLLYLRSF